MSDDDGSFFSLNPRAVLDFEIDRLPLYVSVPVRLGLGAWDDLAFRNEAEEIAVALQPILSLLTFIGTAPKQIRVNRPGTLPSFRIDLVPGGEMEIVPEVNKTTTQNKKFEFYADPDPSTDGVEIDFHLTALPFYAADNMSLWWDFIADTGNAIYATDATAWGWTEEEDSGQGTEGVWQFLTRNISAPQTPPPGTVPNTVFATQINAAATEFVTKFIDKFAADAETRSDSYMCSIGLSGLMFDPDNWLHSYRWKETGPARLSRVRLVDTIGRLIWRGLTGPDIAAGGTVPPNNSTDGPAKVKAFLFAEILGTETDGVTKLAKKKRAIDWLADGIDIYWTRRTALPDDDPGNLTPPYAEAAQLLGHLANVLAADYERVKVIEDGTFPNTPPPNAAAIRQLSLPGLMELMVNRGFFAYEGDRFLDDPGTGTDGFELKGIGLMEAQIHLLQFMAFWDDRPEDARAIASLIRLDMQMVIAALSNTGFGDFTAEQVAKIIEMQEQFSVRYTFDFHLSHIVQEVVNWASAARDAAENLLDYGSVQSVDFEEAIEVWHKGARALVGADRLFQYSRDSWALDSFASSFAAGFLRGLNEEIARQANDPKGPPEGGGLSDRSRDELYKLVRKHLEAIPTGVLLPSIFQTGVLAGCGDYLWKTSKDLIKLVNDPYEFFKAVSQVIKTIYEVPNDVIFDLMGEGLGIQAARELDKLNDSSNSVTFLFNLGRFYGPLIMEELISLAFEAYVVIPVLNRLRVTVRLLLNTPGVSVGPVDEFVNLMRRTDFGSVPYLRGGTLLGKKSLKLEAAEFSPANRADLEDALKPLNDWDPENPAFANQLADPHHLDGPETSPRIGNYDPNTQLEEITLLHVQEARIQLKAQWSQARVNEANAILGGGI